MSVTRQLLAVFRVDRELRGLQSRLEAAERFLAHQTRELAGLGAERDSLETRIRQLTATATNAEGESERISGYIEEHRERMNNAQTSKEYKALLSEVNNLKELRAKHDEEAFESLEQIETLKAQLEQVLASERERTKMREVAEQERKERSDEIADKLADLRARRAELVKDVPTAALEIYEELLETRGDDAMAPLEIVDHKRHEYVCGSSMMSVPVETAVSLMQGKLTISPNDGCILYLTEEDEASLSPEVSNK